MVLPAAMQYISDISETINKTKSLGLNPAGISGTLSEMVELTNSLAASLAHLRQMNNDLGGDSVHSKAFHVRDNVLPAMAAVRTACDAIERIISDKHYPMPSYREMLFVK